MRPEWIESYQGMELSGLAVKRYGYYIKVFLAQFPAESINGALEWISGLDFVFIDFVKLVSWSPLGRFELPADMA